MDNLLPSTSHQATSSSSRLAMKNDVGQDADVDQEAVLRKVISGLRKHVPKLYRQLRVGTQFDPDVVKIIVDIVDKASGGMPWPVGLAFQAVLFLADNGLQAHENAPAVDSLASTVEELRRKLERLKDLGVPDEHQNEVKQLSVKLIAASAVVDDIVGRSSSTRTCRTCLHSFFCAQCNAKEISDVRADLEKCLGNIRDLLTDIIADRMERPSGKAPEVPFHLVGMEERVSMVMRFLRDSGENTRVVGLHGQGGIGKTTLMRIVEANVRSDSQGDDGSQTTHKIASVEVGMQPPALKVLQESLYTQLSDGSKESFSSEAQGRVALKDLMERLKGRGKKICLFLDNVWEEPAHLMELLPQPHDLADALPRGSYLLISSRSVNVAAKLAGMCFKTLREKTKGYLDYPLRMLPKQDAEDLFLRNAAMEEEEKPLQRDDPLVQAIVPRCDGLPLALTVYGSYFKDGNRRKPDVWKRVLQQLERAEDPLFADQRVFQKLKASVDFQDERLQDAFLDVVALLRRDGPLSSLAHHASCGKIEAFELIVEDDDLDYLVDQSLVMRRGRQVEIHDLLFTVVKQMAKERNIWFVTDDTSEDEIAELLHPHPQVRPSIRFFDVRAWLRLGQKSFPSSAQIQDVRYLLLGEWQDQWPSNQVREFEVMITQHCHKLRMLAVDTLIQEQLSWITNLRQLRWLSLEFESFAGISKISSQLRVLTVYLNNNCHVHHDFLSSLLEASFTTLRRLYIHGLEDAIQLKCVGQLGSLTSLSFSESRSLAELPKELWQLGSLTSLDLYGCRSLAELPKELGQLGSLTSLDLHGCRSLAELPKELGQLGSLTSLNLRVCKSLAKLPKELGQLGSLTTLDLLRCTSLAELPKELGQLSSSLKLLYLSDCRSLAELPKELGHLGSLTDLDLHGCTSLAELPKELGHLGSLKSLQLSRCTSLAELPKELGQLGSLTSLDLSRCTSLAELPKELGQLGSSLRILDLSGCTSLAELPKELGQLGSSLTRLDLSGCTSLAELPKELRKLVSSSHG